MNVGMALFKKESDPLTQRARTLTTEIAALEAQIRRLDAQLQHSPAQPRLRSTARPHNSGGAPAPITAREPVFEQVNHERVKSQTDSESAAVFRTDDGYTYIVMPLSRDR